MALALPQAQGTSPGAGKIPGALEGQARQMARPAGIEPTTHCLEGSCSIQLSYGRKSFIINMLSAVLKIRY